MKWGPLDLDRALWHKPTTKTGVPHTIPLPAQLVTRLRTLPRLTEWVFPSSPNAKNGMQAGEWSVTAVEHR
jgi:integrase